MSVGFSELDSACDVLYSVFTGNRTCSDPDLMYQCSNNRCIYKRWMCDGEDDCRNGEDEELQKCNSECPNY